jgi:hypothetical protein
MTKFDKAKKMDHSVFYSGLSSFGNFRTKSRKELNLKI